MAIDEKRITDFLQQSDLRSRVATVLRAAGFIIVWVKEEANGSRWALYLKLPGTLRQSFGTAREVLVWAVQSAEFQARTITQAAEVILQERPRLCEDFSIVITHDPNTQQHAMETAETLDTIFLGFSVSEFSQFKPYGEKDFIASLKNRLYSRDLYDLPSAVHRSEDFFGRKVIVKEIVTRLRSGGGHVGIFGLRKIGKTSLMYRLQTALRNDDAVYVAHVDVERIDAIKQTAEHLLWNLGESIYDSHRQIRRVEGFQLFGQYRLFSAIPDASHVFELFDHDMRLLFSQRKRKLVLMFDEIELLSPIAPGSQWGNAFVRAWRLLRGLDQQYPDRLSFFVTGTNPSIFERNSIEGVESPVYNYFSISYLKPLPAEDVRSLLVDLGQRMGLIWRPEAVERVFSATGGHPALVRALASLVHRSIPRLEAEAIVTAEHVRGAVDSFFTERSSLLSQVVAILEEQYPNEYFLLELLAEARLGEYREYAEAFPSDTAHLTGYGLCEALQQCTKIEIELVQTSLQRRVKQKAAASPHASHGLRPGEVLSGYEVVAVIGHPGGFASVYSARSPHGELVALKVFKNSLLSALQRELAPLQGINHDSVVKVLDHGTSDGGVVFMVMELLTGCTLRDYCTRSTRASESEAITWLTQLLSAMVAFHPDDDRVRQLRALSEITQEQMNELELARHGFVHRDVKPENIMITARGAVLIDFNISVRAATDVVTRSMTDGYMPPEGLGNVWSPELDIYQLGLSVLQAVLGVEGQPTNVPDLREMARRDLNPGLAALLNKMTAPVPADRFTTAAQALSSARRLDQDETTAPAVAQEAV
ncbi:protein kinase [Streptomyces sp. NBC_01102]|uniref:protein kinase domain-containing protein n=1 Tax=unclassified Streptomyces TaxID=2593676 RepID=UPI00386DA3E2|nr:protein kinase [Streptomyces sp. NBC_01102]